MVNILAKAALGYLDRGYSVIPLNGKVPLVPWMKYQKERPTREEVTKWWEDYPNANVGIVTGEISGLVVLDIDSPEQAAEFLDGKSVPETPQAATGKGKHLYFKHPGFHCPNMTKMAPGLDFRGDGGFVVAPPSKHENGKSYKWLNEVFKHADMPSWLVGLIQHEPISRSLDKYLPSVLDGVPEGERDESLFRYACRLRAKNLDYEEAKRLVLEAAAHCAPPFPQSDALTKLDQAWKYSPGMANGVVGQRGHRVLVQGTDRTVQVSWPEKGLYADISGLKQHSDGTISGVLEIKSTAPGVPVVIHSKSLFNFSKARGRSELSRNLNERVSNHDWPIIVDELCAKVTDWASEGEGIVDLAEMTAHEPSYLIYPILLKQEPVVLFGERGSTKSYLALWIATILSSGTTIRDERLFLREAVNVLYLDYEQGEDNMAWRLECLANGMGIKKPTLYYRRCTRPLSADTDRIKKLMLANDIGCLIVDSLGPACGGDLNSAEVALDFHNGLRTLRTSSLIIAHTAKHNQGKRTVYGCYSEDTELLTKSGWKRHDEWREGEEIACFDLKDSVLTWQKPNQLFEYDYLGDMVHVLSPQVDCLVTPNHNLVVKETFQKLTGGVSGPRLVPGHWALTKPDEIRSDIALSPCCVPFRYEPEITDLGIPSDSDDPKDLASVMSVLGWYISEGSITPGCWVLTVQADDRRCQHIEETLEKTGLRFTSATYGPRPQRPLEKPVTHFRILDTQFSRWVERECGDKTQNKKIPDWAFKMGPDLLSPLFAALIDGGGTRQKSGALEYCTTSSVLAGQIQHLAALLGLSSTCTISKARQDGGPDPYYIQICARSRRVHRIRRKDHFSKIPYKGKIYCFSTPTGAYLTRRNGKLTIQGNSVYFENMSRSIFEVRSEVIPGNSSLSVGLAHRKCNFGGLQAPLGFKVVFEHGKTVITPEDARSMPILEAEWSIQDRVIEAIERHGSISPRGLATALGIHINEARDRLTSLLRQGKVDQTDAGAYIINQNAVVPF